MIGSRNGDIAISNQLGGVCGGGGVWGTFVPGNIFSCISSFLSARLDSFFFNVSAICNTKKIVHQA